MKLAEALALRADLVKRIKETRHRAHAAASWQEGDEPAEDAMELYLNVNGLIDQLGTLTAKVNHKNAETFIVVPNWGRLSITEALARRDMTSMLRESASGLADAAAGDRLYGGMRRTRSELREVTTLDIAQLRSNADTAAKAHRILDTAIQQANWNTDLEDE
jgi:hypothetical protein